VNKFNELKCETHNRLDECSFIVPNTCRLCRDNYCHKCYKITDDLEYGWITARQEDFDYNTCKQNCIYKCTTCNKEEIENAENTCEYWELNNDPRPARFLWFNYYTRTDNYNDVPIEYCKGFPKYQVKFQCEECVAAIAAQKIQLNQE
jgi:hypothetical protein